MRKTALLAAVTALVAASPAAANGYLGLEYSSQDFEAFGSGSDASAWQGEFAVGFGGDGWAGQFDGSLGNVDIDSNVVDTWTLAGHLWWADDNWRLGGVIAVAEVDDASGLSDTAYGVEGTYAISPSVEFMSSVTLGESEFLVDFDTFNWDAGVNYFPSPNILIGGSFGIGNIDGPVFGEADTSTFRIGGEFQPWSAPVSITLGWSRFEIEDLDIQNDAFSIGARWNFGGGTLQDRHNAAPFDTNTGLSNRVYGVY